MISIEIFLRKLSKIPIINYNIRFTINKTIPENIIASWNLERCLKFSKTFYEAIRKISVVKICLRYLMFITVSDIILKCL